jgi:putative ABC transport system permease protein
VAKGTRAVLALAWANLTHRKLRTALSALAVGIGIALMLISKGLAAGSLAEVNQRMQSVDAGLVIVPASGDVVFTNGARFVPEYQRYVERVADDKGPLASDVVPVYFAQVELARQQQRVFGVDPAQMNLFVGPRRILEGKAFDRAVDFARRADAGRLPALPENATLVQITARLADGLELIIDDRLRRAGGYQVGDTVRALGHEFRIVGIIETGVAGRVFAPLQTLREIEAAGEHRASMYFVRLRPDINPVAAADRMQQQLEGSEARVELKSEYGTILIHSFASVDLYMTASSGLALVVCFLFILLTMYTMVLERTREIGILKSLGVTRLGLMRLSLTEALIISGSGAVLGILLAFAARGLLAVVVPLLTVELAPWRLATALVLGLAGGLLSALYPGYRAARLQPAVALSYE